MLYTMQITEGQMLTASPQRLRFGEFLADNIVRFINLLTYLLTYLSATAIRISRNRPETYTSPPSRVYYASVARHNTL